MKHWRTNLVLFLIILFSTAILSRLIYLQILNYNFYSAMAKGQQKFFSRILEDRGRIFLKDRGGNLYEVAINRDWPLVFSSPNEIKNKENEAALAAEKLSQILNLNDDSKELVLEKLKSDSSYELIKNKLTDEETGALKNIKLPGIYLGKERLRYYPQGNFLSSTLGFVDRDGKGQYGLEGYWDGILKGEEKPVEKSRGIGEYLASVSFKGKDAKGTDIILTIDYNIQYQAEKLLKRAYDDLNIEGGEIIVIEPNSGKIMALANFPAFDPNFYSEQENFEIFQNGAIQKIFEPGSVFKPITMAAALNEGKITPETTYSDQGFVKIGGRIIYNYDNRVWGERSMTEVLEKSINTGAVFAEKQMGHDVFLEYIRRFKIFEPTGIDIWGEVFSQNKEFKKGYDINFATASFGQGIGMTPMQLVRAFSAIINGGKMVKPYLVEKNVKKDKIIETLPEISPERIISQKTSSELVEMLLNVVEKGFAKGAKISGYHISGKTGTAQIPFSALGINKDGYSEKTIQSFIGFAPAYNPRFLVMVKLNNPEAKTAEYSAVPIFKELAKYIIDYLEIPPDYE